MADGGNVGASGATGGNSGKPASVGNIPIVDIGNGGSGGGNGTGGSGSDTNDRPRNKGGRPPGSKNKPRDGSGGTETGGKAASQSTRNLKPENLVPYIMAFHMMLAHKVPEMMISPDEAAQLSTVIVNYLRHTSVAMSQKHIDLAALVSAIVMIEGTRLFAVANRTRAEKAAQKAAGAGVSNVVQMSPGSWPGMPTAH